MAGTDTSIKIELRPSPAVILCEPQLGENIGTAARAMANFGLWDLRLVRPRDGWPNDKAVAAASRADHVIERVRVFDTLEEAIAEAWTILGKGGRGQHGAGEQKPGQTPRQPGRQRPEIHSVCLCHDRACESCEFPKRT